MILFGFMNFLAYLAYKEKTVEQQPDHPETPVTETKTDELSFVKLHSTLCFLMTRFHKEQSPQLAQFIVRHMHLVIDHPDVIDSDSARNLYLGLLQQWQHITTILLERRTSISKNGKVTH
jgi:hypothetical protein